MTHVVRFTKTYTAGPLKGMQHPKFAQFEDESLAKAFVELTLESPDITNPRHGAPYRIDNPRLESNGTQQA